MTELHKDTPDEHSIIDPIAWRLAQRDIDEARARYLARDPEDMRPEYVPFGGNKKALAAYYAGQAAMLRDALR